MELAVKTTKRHVLKLAYLALIIVSILTACGEGLSTPGVAWRTDSPQVTVRPGGGQIDARVVSTEVIPQNNCGGTSAVTNSIERSLAVIHTVEMGGGLEVSAGGGVGIPGLGQVDVGAAVSAHYGKSFGTQSSLSRGIQVSAKEGTYMEHTVQIKEIWQVGEVEIRSGDQVHVYPFKFRNDMSIELVKSENLGCDPGALATRAAQATPTFAPVSTPTLTREPAPTYTPTTDTSSRKIPTPEPTPTPTSLPSFAHLVASWGSQGSGIAQFDFTGITGVAVDSAGDLFVADPGNGRVQKFSPDGEYLGQIEPEEGVLACEDFSVAVDGADNVYLLEKSRGGGLVKYSPGGEFLGVNDPLGRRDKGWRGEGFRYAAFDKSGKLYLIYHRAGGTEHLVVLEPDGRLITDMRLPEGYYDSSGGTSGVSYGNLALSTDGTAYVTAVGYCLYPFSLTRGLMDPWSRENVQIPSADEWNRRSFQPDAVAIGPDGKIYTASSFSQTVDQVSPDGEWLSALDLSSLDDGSFYPHHIAISAQGTIYLASRQSGRIVSFQLTN